MITQNFVKKQMFRYKYQLFFILLISIVSLFIKILTTYYTGRYVDLLIYELNKGTIYKFTIILFILGITKIIIGFINSYLTVKLQTNMIFNINFDILNHIKKLPVNYFKNKDSFYLNQRISSDSNAVVSFILNVSIKVVTLIVSFVSLFIILIRLNTYITIAAIMSIPVYILLYRCFKCSLYKNTLFYKESQNRFFSYMGRQLNNISYIKINSLSEVLDKKLLNAYPTFFKSAMKYLKSSILFSSTGSIIDNVFNVFLFLYAGMEIMNNKMTVGDFIAIKGYYAMIMSNIGEFSGVLKQYPDALVSCNRLLEILNTKEDINGEQISNYISNIDVNNLRLTIDDVSILNNISYKFNKGKVYLLKGKNGAGKSTFIKCILGLYNNEFEGSIKYNNIDIKDMDMYELRKNIISVVDQDAEFFFNNIKENLELETKNTNDEYLSEYINTFKINIEKCKTCESEEFIQLSGGEKQKISIIRGLLKEPEFLIMDEPTSALDSKSVEILIEEINKIKDNKIVLIVSHDDRIFNISDEILDLDEFYLQKSC